MSASTIVRLVVSGIAGVLLSYFNRAVGGDFVSFLLLTVSVTVLTGGYVLSHELEEHDR